MINEEDVIARDLPLLRQRMQAEAAAEGRKLEDSSDEELTKRAEEMGGDASNYQSAYTLGRRADGTPGLDINKPRQKTLAQLIRGDQEPLPAFFEGVTEAMQQALSEINTQRINYKVSPNAGREVETRPLGDDPVNLAVRYGEGTTQQTQAPLAKQRIRVRDEAVAKSGAEKLFGTRAEREQAVRSSDVAGQNAMAAMQGGPEVRAEYMNKRLAAELAKMDAAGQEVMDEDIVRIRTEIMEDVLTNVYREQDLSSAQLGVAVDSNTGLFTAVPEPEAQETSYEANPRRVKYIQENIDDPDTLDFANFLIRLEENDEIGKSQRSAIKRLTDEITQRSSMGMPLTKEMLSKLQEDSRFKGAFNAINRIKDDDPEILENVFNAMEVAGAIPMLAPVGRGALLARSGAKGARNLLGLAAKSKPATTGGFKATAQRSAQATGPGSGGVVFTSQQGGRTTATVQVVKTRPGVVTNIPKGTKAGLRRVGDKFAEQPRKGTRGNLRAENAPAPLGGNRKAILFAIPFDNSSEEEIEASTEIQNNALNYIIGLEDFSNKPYKDGDATSIGFGTRAKEGQQSITRDEAAQEAQVYLEKEVYPEIDFIQENGSRSLNERQIVALSSLIYNVGSTAWRKSKARKALLAGDMETFKEEAFSGPNAFLTKNPSFLAGLKNRREKELALFEDNRPRVPVG